MSYNSRNPTIAFRVTSYEKGKLEKESSKEKTDVANFCKSIIHQYLAGDIIKNEKSLEQELQKARLEKIKVETNEMGQSEFSPAVIFTTISLTKNVSFI